MLSLSLPSDIHMPVNNTLPMVGYYVSGNPYNVGIVRGLYCGPEVHRTAGGVSEVRRSLVYTSSRRTTIRDRLECFEPPVRRIRDEERR
jgi:hypothetical protein